MIKGEGKEGKFEYKTSPGYSALVFEREEDVYHCMGMMIGDGQTGTKIGKCENHFGWRNVTSFPQVGAGRD